MITGKTFQLMYDEVSKVLPNQWEKLVIYLEYGEDAYSYAFYISENNKYINGYDIPNISEEKIAMCFRNIDKAVLKERNASKEDLWTNMTMIVESTGAMHTDFDYTDLSEGAYAYKKAWKKKYLV